MALVFPNEDTLRMALTSGLAPSSLSLSPAHCARRADGSMVLSPAMAVPDSVVLALRNFGVTIGNDPSDGRPLMHWLEALSLTRVPQQPTITDQTPILFELPASTAADLVGEMLRLGNDRQSFRLLRFESGGLGDGMVLLRVLGPPYFTLLRAIDRNETPGPCAYIERAPGVWVELGWTHSLVDQVRAPDGQLVLLRPPHQWRYLSAAEFQDIYDALTLEDSPNAIEWSDEPADPLDVPLRLVAGNATDVPELWVFDVNGEDQIDALAHEANVRVLSGLSFAVGETERGRVAVLRSRPSKQGPPALTLAGARAYRPFQRVPNLFLPCGASLAPPLSREIVRRLLADDTERVVWLAPLANGDFVPQSLPEEAFRPLGDWIDHVLATNRAALSAWTAESRCEFGDLVSKEPLIGLRSARTPLPSRAQPEPRQTAAAPPPARSPRPTRPPRTAVTATPAAQSPTTLSAAQLQLRAAEDRFLEIDGPLEAPERQALWPDLGQLNARLDHAAEAALCWLHAQWESTEPQKEIAWAWVQSEHALAARGVTDADLARLMIAHPTTTADMRPLTAMLVWATAQSSLPPAIAARLPMLQNYLRQHDRLLPVRAVWLVWHGLTQRAGGDHLALASVRDRLLERLRIEGLSAERDLPVFMRFAGQHGGDRLRTVRDRLERLRKAIHRWSGFSRGDSLQQTPAYIDLMFAFASARLGEVGSARALLVEAAATLDASGNDAHRFLLEAFRWRIEQVIAGKPHAGPLPPEQMEYLEQMRRDHEALDKSDPLRTMPPYVVERMRTESRILDPHEELDPYRHIKLEHDELIRELARLADVHDSRALRDGLRRLIAGVNSKQIPEVRLRILAEALPLAARVGAACCSELLEQVGPMLRALPETADPNVQGKRALLVERSLFFAMHFDRSDLVPVLIAQLESLIAEPATSGVLEARSRLSNESLRSLRKCGLRDQTDRLLQILADAAHYDPNGPVLSGDDRSDMETTRTLLHVAAGWLSTDQPDRARPILDAARALILPVKRRPDRPAALLVSLVCTYVGALARAPLEEALNGVEEMFTSGRMDRLPNTFTTSAYFSRFHLNIVEAVVSALANEEFAMGPAARRWLDDDEYLVRRRIHRDVRVALNES